MVTKTCLAMASVSYICSMKKIFFFLLVFSISVSGIAQTKWTLQQCIDYAVQHNIQIKQSELNAKLSGLQLQQNKASVYPNLNADINNGYSLGRSIDPTSNSFINQGYFFNGFSANSNVLVFGWFAKKYQRQQSEFDLQASIEQYKQLNNDLALNIATGYLRILLAKEQIAISQAQLKMDLDQYNFTRKRVDAGQLAELSAAQLQAQVMIDSTNLTNSYLDVNGALLDMRALLNMDMEAGFDIVTPSISNLNVESLIAYPSAQAIYEIAQTKRPMIQANDYKIKSATKQVDIAKSALYPQLSIGASIGTNYASTVRSITSATQNGEEVLGNIKFQDSLIPITRPTYKFTTATVPLFTQFGNNIRQTISAGLSIPVFNGYSSQTNIARAKIALQSAQLTQDLEKNTLKQNVYKAYNDAQSAIQKHKAAKNAEKSSGIALDYAVKRYQVGLINTQEYTSQQNALTRAKINTLLAQYDLVFKLKILDFYLGKNIEL
jgi:outer membrane protein